MGVMTSVIRIYSTKILAVKLEGLSSLKLNVNVDDFTYNKTGAC